MKGTKVFVFSGLADNEQFHRTVASLGCEVVGARAFPDHHRYSRQEVEQILEEAAHLGVRVVTSEKDGVKIDDPAIAVLEASMHIPSLPRIVDRICVLAGK